MLRCSSILGALCALVLLAAPVSAQTSFVASLAGANEVPPVATAATGTVVATLDGPSLVLSGGFTGLEGDYTMSHIHVGAAGANGGVVFALAPTVGTDSRSGTFDPAANTFTLTMEQMVTLEASGYYINVHSALHPGGEIRGQLAPAQADLIITGVFDGPRTGGTPKGVELYAVNDIADLSAYGIGSANNGGGTDGVEFVLSGSATAGQFLYVASEAPEFEAFFGFAPTFTDGAANINGDDAIELFYAPGLTVGGAGAVIDLLGQIDVDGTGTGWDHLDGWAYRVDGTGPDGSTFEIANWTFSGVNGLEGGQTNATVTVPFPIGTYQMGGGPMGPTVSFVTAASSAAEGATADILATISYGGGAPDGNPITVVLAFRPTSSSADAADLMITTGEATFSGNTDGEQVAFQVALTAGDGPEGPEFAEFALGVSTGGMLGSPVFHTLTIEDGDGPPPLSTIAAARTLGVGNAVTIRGTVTRAKGAFTYLQDETAGLTVRQAAGAFFDEVTLGTISTGTQLEITGTLSEFRQLLQINAVDLTSYTNLGQGTVPAAQVVTLSEIETNGEAYEGELVRVNTVVINPNGAVDFAPATSYAVSDAGSPTSPVVVRVPNAADSDVDGTPIPTANANVVAVVGQFNTADPTAGYQLLVINAGDVENAVSTEAPGADDTFALSGVRPNPAAGAFAVSFVLDQPGAVRLSVVDVLGREVAVLADGEREAGAHTEAAAERLAPGTYLLRLESAGRTLTQTMTVVR
jgi:hypothetical protein